MDFSDHYGVKLYDYAEACNPILPEVPIKTFSIVDEIKSKTNVYFFDNSNELDLNYRATSPNLLAAFLTICTNEPFEVDSSMVCSSQLFYVIRGKGFITINDDHHISFATGDLVTTPFYEFQHIIAMKDTEIYWVSDYPLLQYMGLKPTKQVIPPTLYRRELMESYLREICNAPEAKSKNRNGILLANTITEKWNTKTLTHILWALLNEIPPNTVQKAHRHNSVALDYCVYSNGQVYTSMGKELLPDGSIKDPVKVHWATGACFTTPPGWWHCHVNEGCEKAIVLPIQDAGLYTYQRTLDIQFT